MQKGPKTEHKKSIGSSYLQLDLHGSPAVRRRSGGVRRSGEGVEAAGERRQGVVAASDQAASRGGGRCPGATGGV